MHDKYLYASVQWEIYISVMVSILTPNSTGVSGWRLAGTASKAFSKSGTKKLATPDGFSAYELKGSLT